MAEQTGLYGLTPHASYGGSRLDSAYYTGGYASFPCSERFCGTWSWIRESCWHVWNSHFWAISLIVITSAIEHGLQEQVDFATFVSHPCGTADTWPLLPGDNGQPTHWRASGDLVLFSLFLQHFESVGEAKSWIMAVRLWEESVCTAQQSKSASSKSHYKYDSCLW